MKQTLGFFKRLPHEAPWIVQQAPAKTAGRFGPTAVGRVLSPCAAVPVQIGSVHVRVHATGQVLASTMQSHPAVRLADRQSLADFGRGDAFERLEPEHVA